MNALSEKSSVTLQINPTVFEDFNKKNGLAADHVTTQIIVERMKHKHIRVMQAMKEADQIHYIMSQLTGLSQADLDELDAEDSAALSEIIFGFMKKYAMMAREMAGSGA